ncbi:MAG: lipopolysaccharide transport periplasmic protein LptA [Gammaproteobacteria bacterium]|nr:lipopolysaccharide transport periplasmic protein LptA [Gammaproteobacteria bacterium]MDH5801547.1 lipopolysaccharide transport periplasmic protein LptA [Gammaproteobacteria bacterium]
MFNSRLTLCLFALTLAFTPAGNPAAKDKMQPITIEADRATLDEKKGVSTYSGHVLLTQGGIKINADTLIVHSDKGDLSHVTAIGSPVRYVQEGKINSENIKGEANTMEYFAREKRLLLLENARLTQGGNAFSGNRIDYDTQKEVVTAAVDESGQQRVQVTIQPPSQESENDPASIIKIP